MCLTGQQDAEILRAEKMEALAGQNVTLPCAVEFNKSVHVSMIEWSRKGITNKKLVLYSSTLGRKQFSPNVTLTVNTNTMVSHLRLHGVTKWNSGIYICSLSTFPLGSIRGETELKVIGKRTKLLLTFRCSALTSNYSQIVAYDPRCSWLHQGTAAPASPNSYLLQRRRLPCISFAFVALAIVFQSPTGVRPKLRRQVTITGGVVGLHRIQLGRSYLRCCRSELTSHYLSIRCWSWDDVWCNEALLWGRLEENVNIEPQGLLLTRSTGGQTASEAAWNYRFIPIECYNLDLGQKQLAESAAELLALLWLTEQQHRKPKPAQQLYHRSTSYNRMSPDQWASSSSSLFLSLTLNFSSSSGWIDCCCREPQRLKALINSTGPQSPRLTFAVIVYLTVFSFQFSERKQSKVVLFYVFFVFF